MTEQTIIHHLLVRLWNILSYINIKINVNESKINGVLGHSVLKGYTGPGTTWANEMNFAMHFAPGAGSIARPLDQAASLSYGYPR